MDSILGSSSMPETFEDLVFEDQETWSSNTSYSQSLRPLLDVVDKLSDLNLTKEGIELPSIVVIGDQSSGKYSLLESLAGISLGICSTRAPLILRLQKSEAEDCGIVIQYKDKKKHITESQITYMLNSVMKVIARTSKGISDRPIILHVKKIDAPDLTMVDLPSIIKEPEDIYQQISTLIMKYISPKECTILNVLSAVEDSHICESMRMSMQVDVASERTVAVVTVIDKVSDGLLDAVNRGLGYVYICKRVGDESHGRARKREAELFRSNPELNTIDKSMVSIPVLANRLMEGQTKRISQFLPDIVKKIDKKLLQRQTELRALPQQISDTAEAMIVFMKMINGLKDSLNKLLIDGDYREFLKESDMHCAARLKEMFENYYQELLIHINVEDKKHFLVQETRVWKEARRVGLPNFLSCSVIANLLQKPIEEMLRRSLSLTSKVWEYMEKVVVKVIDSNFQSYPCLLTAATRASQALASKRKEQCIQYVTQMIDMEKSMDFTLNPVYLETSTKLLQQKDQFMKEVRRIVEEHYCAHGSGFIKPIKPSVVFGNPTQTTVDNSLPTQPTSAKFLKVTKIVFVPGIGKVDIKEVMKTPTHQLEVAFDMKMRLIAYWKVIIQRVSDGIPLYLQFVYQNLIKNDLGEEIMKKLSGIEISKALGMLMQERPRISIRRKNLKKSVDSLMQSQKEVAKIRNQIGKAE